MFFFNLLIDVESKVIVLQREYEEFKIRTNALVAKAQKMPEEGWTMQDGTPWPGNNPRDHPGMIQVFLGHSGGLDTDGNELPRLVYVSREKRPGFQHHKKAGAMNALVSHPYLIQSWHKRYKNLNKSLVKEIRHSQSSERLRQLLIIYASKKKGEENMGKCILVVFFNYFMT